MQEITQLVQATILHLELHAQIYLVMYLHYIQVCYVLIAAIVYSYPWPLFFIFVPFQVSNSMVTVKKSGQAQRFR